MTFLRLSIDPGGEKFLKFAKKKLEQLKKRWEGALEIAGDEYNLDGFSLRISYSPYEDTIQIRAESTPAVIYLIYVSANTAGMVINITVTPPTAGTGYTVGDVLTLSGGKGATVQVNSVGGNGSVTNVSLITAGMGYTKTGYTSTTGGNGTGCVIEIDTISEADPYYQLRYDPPPNGIGGDYRVLAYTVDAGALKAAGTTVRGLTISDSGTSLVIQSGSGVHNAVLANVYTYNETIDAAEFGNTGWNSVVDIFAAARYVGNPYDYNWSKKEVTNNGKNIVKYIPDKTKMIIGNSAARHWMGIGSDGYINQCMFGRKDSLLGTGVISQELGLIPQQFYQLWKHEISYRVTPESDIVTGAFIGDDYQVGTLGVDSSGYSWKLHFPIVVIDKDNALVKTVANSWSKGGNKPYPYQINLVVTNRWYLDRTPPVFYETTDTWRYDGTTHIEDDAVTRTEILTIGGLEIERLTYTETRYVSGNASDGISLTWTPGAFPPMTLVSSSGDAHGGFGDGVSAASGSISGPGQFNATLHTYSFYNPSTGRDNVAWYNVIIGIENEFTKNGERDLHVMAYDCMSGYSKSGSYSATQNFIVFYKKSKVNFYHRIYVPNSTDGTWPSVTTELQNDPVTTEYYMAYQVNGGGLQKINIGSDIRVPSCQINGGYMVYTYVVYDKDAFKNRIVGLINLKKGTKNEINLSDDDARLNDFKHFHHAAIGVI
ncbi:hypothetical protein [Candidatus Magnetominusculus xianensis]|uniref:Uncharacterized protein n=1 Tax=Candidatus Magnetominusculus xianensis TaxID=1748249 RepID=A0ABR5SEC6_9BACT|nr:hypothetical protein [Candidatus Magnetominusculus xianensis]KWT73773.1 hypothetical protein ASN18_3355 [Candidatus Magnetominusculus xianensis]MBF0404794.1 hypothetical protein [Nitrospirota bacterium]